MGVESVHDQHDRLAGDMDIGAVPEDMGKVLPGAPVGDLARPPARQGRRQHDEIGGAIALGLEVTGRRRARARRQGRAGRPGRLPRGLVKTDQHLIAGEVPTVGLEPILHGPDEVGILLGGTAPALAQPGLATVVLSVLWTVEREMVSATLRATPPRHPLGSASRGRVPRVAMPDGPGLPVVPNRPAWSVWLPPPHPGDAPCG